MNITRDRQNSARSAWIKGQDPRHEDPAQRMKRMQLNSLGYYCKNSHEETKPI